MKNLHKRSLAWLTSLLLLISLFSSLIVLPAQAATVDYVYSGKYVYNWGTREEVATFMSPNAEKWYTKNNTSYEELASLSGSSSVSSVPSSTLYKELKSLMSSNHKHITDYGETKDLFRYTDCENSGGKISSFYSGKAIGPTWDGGWNREHTWPNSKGDGDAEDDIMMLRPTSTSENSSRGNKAYGQSSGYYNPNSESGGKHDLRGDVARIMLYVYCRWGNTTRMWGTAGVMESRDVLLQWVEEDPVDTWELGRNDSVETITGTRNVFVDYPELIFVLFDADIPTDYQSPSGMGSLGSYSITATSSDTAHGTVTVSGKTVTAHPANGYAVTGYTILSGDADVVRNGNTFTVNAASDVSIRIEFGPRTQVTLTLMDNGNVYDTLTAYSGDDVTLPAWEWDLPDDGTTFVGWTEAEVATTVTMPTYYSAGSKYTVGRDTALYALFSRTEMDGGTLSNIFEPYSGELTPGDYLIVFNGKAMFGAVTDKTRLQNVEISTTGDNVIVTDDAMVWHIAQNGTGWTMQNLGTGTYAAGTGYKSSNQATLIAQVTDFAKWNATVKSTGYEFTNVGNEAAGVNPLLRFNPSVDAFACYAKNTNVGGPNTLYKRAGGTTYYFTGAGGYCEHEYDDDRDTDCNLCGAIREVATHTPGDINDDGKINNRDLAALQQHLNEWGVTINEDAADVTADGKINNRDLALLQQYLNEWDVELK